jgi:pyruvate,water dikinase
LRKINADASRLALDEQTKSSSMASQNHIRWFREIRLGDVGVVGGKTASLGELYSVLAPCGVQVPNGFALTAEAYREALTAAGAWDRLHDLLDGLDKRQVEVLAQRAAEARQVVFEATGGTDLRRQIAQGYRQLQAEYGAGVALAVRSSATAEDRTCPRQASPGSTTAS